jgi:transcriptional regulator with XRE-family HTH domain
VPAKGRSRPDEVHRSLISTIRELLRRRRWSANQLADFSSVGRGYLSDVLAGHKSPTVRTLVKLARALDVEVKSLFG